MHFVGITDDEDFFEGSGDASVPLGGGQFGGGQGGRPLGGGSSSGRLPIDSFDDGVEGSGAGTVFKPFFNYSF